MRRLRNGTLVFDDYPEFRPNLTPAEMFAQGAFGGTYWRPIYSSVTKRHYKDEYKEFPFLDNIDRSLLCSSVCDLSKNKYKVHSGTSLEYWESHGWITAQDPYGWVQWYCRFYAGRRTRDDERQIKRWLAFAGPNGRFLRRLVNKIHQHGRNDRTISPVIRQGLHHWAKVVTTADL